MSFSIRRDFIRAMDLVKAGTKTLEIWRIAFNQTALVRATDQHAVGTSRGGGLSAYGPVQSGESSKSTVFRCNVFHVDVLDDKFTEKQKGTVIVSWTLLGSKQHESDHVKVTCPDVILSRSC